MTLLKTFREKQDKEFEQSDFASSLIDDKTEQYEYRKSYIHFREEALLKRIGEELTKEQSKYNPNGTEFENGFWRGLDMAKYFISKP